MKILVMSDSHRQNDRIDEILNKHRDIDAYIHCGDLCVDPRLYPQLLVVAGNGDYYYSLPKELQLTLGGHRIYVTHSHFFPYYQKSIYLARKAKELHCDIVFYGHTHIPHFEEVEGITILNPGSLFYNRDRSQPSYAIVELDDKINVQFHRFEERKEW